MTAPIPCFYDGEAFVPRERFRKLCDKEFIVGETYPLVVQEERSQGSHRQYFAALHEAWQNLPETVAGEFLNEDHLRKYALIRTGFCDKQSIVASNATEAQRIAAFVQPVDPYALITVSDKVVTRYTAHSQSTRAMGRATFQASKQSVLDFVASLVGVKPSQLSQSAERAA